MQPKWLARQYLHVSACHCFQIYILVWRDRWEQSASRDPPRAEAEGSPRTCLVLDVQEQTALFRFRLSVENGALSWKERR